MARKTTTLKPYVYASGRVVLMDVERYSKAVKRSRSDNGTKEQAQRRRKSPEKVKAKIFEAIEHGEKVNLSYLGKARGSAESSKFGRRTFLIDGGKSRAILADWLGGPVSAALKRYRRPLRVRAEITDRAGSVEFHVQPNPGLPWAGNVGRWIESTAVLLLEKKPERKKKPKKGQEEGEEPEDPPSVIETEGESTAKAGRSDATMEPEGKELRRVLILDVSVLGAEEGPREGEVLSYEEDDRKRPIR